MKEQDIRDCNITEYEGIKDVKILAEGSGETFNLESKNVRFEVSRSPSPPGRRSISGHLQDPQLLEPGILLSSETFQMTGIFRDINRGTEHNLKFSIMFENISNDFGNFKGTGRCVEIS